MAAREEITLPSFFKDFPSRRRMSIHQVVLLEIESLSASQRKLDSASEEMQELRNKLQSMNSMLYMIEVLQTVGPEIDQFRQDVPKLSAEELAVKVAYLLIRKGFVEYEYLESLRPFSYGGLKESYQGFLKSLGNKLGSQLESKDVAMVRKINGIVLINLM